jgi:hypothetical protein
MLEQGADPTGTPPGPTAICAVPGETVTVYVWFQDSASLDCLNSYQIIIPWNATATGGASGTVTYVNNNPGPGNSVLVNQTDPDWVFINAPPAPNEFVAYNETAAIRFGVIYLYEPGQCIQVGPGSSVPNPGGPNYIMQFDLQVSANASGTFDLPFIVAPAPSPNSVFFDQTGGAYGGIGAVTFQPLQVIVGPCCGVADSGSCLGIHPTPTCDDATCCNLVCGVDPSCCSSQWDQNCVQIAVAQCDVPPCPTAKVYACEDGRRDDFATADGPELASPSAALLNGPACQPPGPVEFDTVPVEQCFKHTFSGCWPSCPDGICSKSGCGTVVGATLEIRVSSGGGNDDAIHFMNGGTSVSFALLSCLISPWPGTDTITLDLAALPECFDDPNILDTLCDGELGLYIEDDTGVDYATLTVVHCPCDSPFSPFFERDQDDDFMNPAPSTPAADLLAFMNACSNGPLTQYDVMPCDQCFGDTITGLPPCLLDALLNICVRLNPDCGGGAADDGLGLEFSTKNGTPGFAWSMSLSALAFSPPLAPGVTSCVSLDLDNLPPDANGTRNIVSELLDGDLDIFIEDDTGVDYIFLGPDACGCCSSVGDCGDLDNDGIRDDACAWYACDNEVCSSVSRGSGNGGQFGQADMGSPAGPDQCSVDGVADNNDRNHALNCFANSNFGNPGGYACESSPPAALNVDAGSVASCVLDGVCDSNDAFHALNSFANTNFGMPGGYPCTCTDGPAPAGPPVQPVEYTGLLLLAPEFVRPGELVDIDVHLTGSIKALRGYQLHLGVSGGQGGSLELVDVAVSSEREDYAYSGLAGTWKAFNRSISQMVVGMDATEGAPAQPGAYLATFTYRVPEDASGRFVVEVLYDADLGSGPDLKHRTFLFGHGARPIGVTTLTPARITVAKRHGKLR